MNSRLAELKPYPFARLNALLEACEPAADKKPIALTIGEPQHKPPDFVLERLQASAADFSRYPNTLGIPGLRQAAAAWLKRRFDLNVDAEQQILPCAGTREALFSFAQAMLGNSGTETLVAMPNPGYQIYEGAALLAGATPLYINPDEHGQLDYASVSAADWQRCKLLYLCSPGNPSGAVLSMAQYSELLQLAEQHDFVIAADECYAEIYPTTDGSEAPMSLLQACLASGNASFKRCVAFHSLSKRSNLPGLRSGFMAGDAELLKQCFQYRTYHGATLPLPVQKASIAAWNDDAHVAENRVLYQKKYAAVLDILHPVLNVEQPAGSFYLWPELPIDGERFCRELYEQQAVKLLPGAYLARDNAECNPGKFRARIALTPELADCSTAAKRIKDYISNIAS